MGGRGAKSSKNGFARFKVKEGLSRITDYDADRSGKRGYAIERETENAVMLGVRETVQSGYSYDTRSDSLSPRFKGQAIWLPKSQIQIYKGRVVAIKDWLAKRHGIHTETYKGLKKR